MEFVRKYKRWLPLLMLLLAVGLVLLPDMALAGTTTTLGEMGSKAGENFKGLFSGLKMFAWFAGFALCVVALLLFASMKKPGNQTPVMVPALMFICGVCLLGFMTITKVGSASLFGSDETGDAMSALVD